MFKWFETRVDPYPKAEPSEPPKGFVAFCLHFLDGTKFWLVVMTITAGLIALVEIILFSFLGNIIDWLSSANKQTFFANEGATLLLMSLVVLVLLPVLSLINTLVIHQTLVGNLPQRIRWMAHRYLMRQSMSFFADEFAGRIATKLMQTALGVREVVLKLLDMLTYITVYFIGAVVLAASNHLLLALPFMLWLIAYIAVMTYFVPKLGVVAQHQADARSMMTGRIVDAYSNISTVKLFSHSMREDKYVHESMADFMQTVHKQMRLGSYLETLIDILNALLLFSLAAIGIFLWQQGELMAGALAASMALVLRMQGMSHWIMWEMSALFENIGTVRDGINTISVECLVQDLPDAKTLERVKGNIEFKNVVFNYGNQDKTTIIDNFNLTIKQGEKIGFVGRSGAGKSTLVNLLLRFYDVNGGSIKIDGNDISKVTQESLRANIGMVSQDTSLLHRTVRENITYGRPDASEEEMIRAAKLAKAHEFILDLEDKSGNRGYDAQVGERGVKLSGGQRQRVAIARVLLKDAPILLLDEATSALDSEVEAAIQEQFTMLMKGKTTIAIAHRLSTIAAMDRLIVIDEGKIVEQGTHNELIKAGGIYAHLWAHQSGGFLDVR